MAKADFFNRIEQEIGYGNYSEIKRITLTILRNEPDNKDASYIRDYIECHKKSNGRYETISLVDYLDYISGNVDKFKSEEDNKYFLVCIFKDLKNIYTYSELYSLMNNNKLKNALHKLEPLNNPNLEELINRLKEIQDKVNQKIDQSIKEEQERERRLKILEQQRIEEERRRQEHERFLEQEEARKREREAKKKVILFIIAVVAVIIAFAIKCS